MKKRNWLLRVFAAALSLALAFAAGAEAIEWQKCLGGSDIDYANSIQQTSGGGYIGAGYTNSTDGGMAGNHGDADAWVVKLNASGDIVWQKCLGGSNNDSANSIQQTSDGGYIVAGSTQSTDGDVTGFHLGNYGSPDVWVVKLNASGNIEWQKCLGGSGQEYADSIQQTSDGGYIVAGYTQSTDGDVDGFHGGDSTDAWVVKLNSSGDILWQKCLGGSYADYARSIQQTSDGGYIVAGETGSTDGDVVGHHGAWDAWVVKLNASGGIEWQKCLGDSGGDAASSIQQMSDGGYIVAGSTQSTDGDGHYGSWDVWVFKLNASGDIEWQRHLGGSNVDFANSIQQTSDGGYIVAGGTSSTDGDVDGFHGGDYDAWVVKLSPGGGGLTITTTTLPNGTVGTPYNAVLEAAGGSGSITWTLADGSGSLPSGLTLSSSGTISGTPAASGTANFTVKAASGTVSATKALSITIDPAGGGGNRGGGGCNSGFFSAASALLALFSLWVVRKKR
jgi:hypothetical protein